MTKTLVKIGSGNSKTGFATVTYRTQETCPTTCPLMGKGCYAKGRIFGIPERYVPEEDNPEYQQVRQLVTLMPKGGIFRANVSGDFLDENEDLDHGYADALSFVAQERPDTDTFSYTHAWRKLKPNFAPGVVVNASCESEHDLEEAAAAGWPTVVVDAGGENTLIGKTVGGRKVVQCPAQTKGLTCEQCRLCARPNRAATVAFATHGSGKNIAAAQVMEARA